MKQKAKKMVLVGSLLFMTMGLVGCGAKSNDLKTMNNDGVKNIKDTVSAVHDAQNVSKKDVKQVRTRLEEVKKEITKIQLDKTLSKEQKATKIQALQKELGDMTNKAMGK